MAQEGKDIVLPPEFSGPAQLLLYTRYGDPRQMGWENKWLHTWAVQETFPWFPEKKLKIHKHFWPMLAAAFEELEDEGLHSEIMSVGPCHHVKFVSDDNTVLSVHSWGAGLDMNVEKNPMGSIGSWSEDLIGIMEKHNIHCGQNWTGFKEPCHFAMVNG